MGLFGLFGSKGPSEEKEEKQLPWKPLTTLEQLETIATDSKTRTVVIFKHSTRCGISRMVIRQFEGAYDIDPEKMDLYYLDLLAYRNVSDEVGFKFQVLHQSPQLLVIKNGVAVTHASHSGIQADALAQYV